jgi:hypothetical protein
VRREIKVDCHYLVVRSRSHHFASDSASAAVEVLHFLMPSLQLMHFYPLALGEEDLHAIHGPINPSV